MYPDRLVIKNPGGLFGPVTIDSLGEEGISSARNATLIKLLEDVPLPGETRTVCENRGSGIRSMLDSLLTAGMSPPRFEDRISSFIVTFPNHTLLSEDTVRWITALGERGLSDSQCVALALLREEEVLDNRAYRTATGVDSRVATAEETADQAVQLSHPGRTLRQPPAPQHLPSLVHHFHLMMVG
jgi:ATP-dependent DNA helicase RecG